MMCRLRHSVLVAVHIFVKRQFTTVDVAITKCTFKVF